jgi:phage terminase small subunit
MPRKSSAAVAFSTTSTAKRLRPPDDLIGPERKLFVDLVLGCRPDHFQPTDAPLLAAYCRAVWLEQTASSELAAAGFVIDGRPSGWLNILAQATRTISTYSRMLKLNPAGRQSVPSSEPEPVSYYEKMSLLQGQRDDDAN